MVWRRLPVFRSEGYLNSSREVVTPPNWLESPLSVHLSHAPQEDCETPATRKSVEAYLVFTPAKRPVLEIGDVNTIWS